MPLTIPSDPFRTEVAARARGEIPHFPLSRDRVRWGGRLYAVDASSPGWVDLCPHPACLPIPHDHMRLGAFWLAHLQWNAAASEFRGPVLPSSTRRRDTSR